jgi:hypothetical protein
MRRMDKYPIEVASIRARVAALPNVQAFADRHGLAPRTLYRIVASAKPDAGRSAKKYQPSAPTLRVLAQVFDKLDAAAAKRSRRADKKAGR